jgi:hypothetical protein
LKRIAVKRFKKILAEKTGLDENKITITSIFYPRIVAESSLAMRLIELIKTYDNLVATLKLLHLVGCFGSEQDYYANITRIQKIANQVLSKIITW